ncbi:hypothetical protein M5E87_10610 [Flavonifractor plautii]|nr:hypothetical protein M5E87_10610 [Flavonifractor plautii]
MGRAVPPGCGLPGHRRRGPAGEEPGRDGSPAAAICAEMLGVKTVIPMHYRTQEYLEQFQQYLAVRCPECRCLAMKAGESVTL